MITESQLLRGKTLLLTRALEDVEDWTLVLEENGARVLHLPCIRTEVVRDGETPRHLKNALASADWLVLTSRRGATTTARLHPEAFPPGPRIACVGPRTAAEARRLFGRADLVSPGGHGRDLAATLAQHLEEQSQLEGARVVVAAADRARPLVEEVLEPRGVIVTRIVTYQTFPAPPCQPRLLLSAREVDAVLLASPSAAEGLCNVAEVPDDLQIITIGPTTTAAARELGLRVSAQAPRPCIEGLLEVMP